MSKTQAHVTLPNGAKVTIEGSPAEVAEVVKQLGSTSSATTKNKVRTSKKITTSPTDLILSLADGGFFELPKDLAAIKQGLAEIGHIYPVQTLSSILFKMVRKRYLRRLKENGRWVYLR